MSLFRNQRRIVGRWILQFVRTIRNIIFGKKILPDIEKMPSRILIIRPYFLGDILLCLPVAQAIKSRRPDIQISWLLRGEWKSLLEGHSVVDEVLSFSQFKMHSAKSLFEFIRVVRELQHRRFDLVINLAWDRSSIFWSWFSGAPVRLGIEEYGRPRLLSLLYTATVIAPERSKDQRHMADFYYEPLRLLGFPPRKDLPKIFPTSEEQERVNQIIALKLDSSKAFILIHPGVRLPDRQWPVDCFYNLIQQLRDRTSETMVLVCGPKEEAWVADFSNILPQGRSLFWPQPTLGEFIALAQRSKFLIGNVSGPMHLAAAAGCRVISLFGVHSNRWRPLGDQHIVLEGISIKEIPVQMVLDAVQSQLNVSKAV